MTQSVDDVHGLAYPSDFLDSLPSLALTPQPAASTSTATSHTPIRRLTALQFASMHLKYVTTHAPDHVLFPFLHGLEGDNEAQNQFFASAGTVCLPAHAVNPQTGTLPYVPQVPKFRGLVWVAADDAPTASAHPQPYDPDLYAYMDTLYSDSEADDTYSTSSASTTSDDDDFDEADVASVEGRDAAGRRESYLGIGEVPMDLDLEMDVDGTITGDRGITALRGNEGEHMHPVKERSKAIPATHPAVSPTTASPAARTSSSSPSGRPAVVPTATDSHHVAAHPAPAGTAYPPIPLSPPPIPLVPQSHPILTSSFRPRDLLRESVKGLDLAASPNPGYAGMGAVERFGGGANGHADRGVKSVVGRGEGIEWEFVEPKVPDGISLRNFGIQAPIFATISDIVVYSPRGNTSASISLAQKFKQAVEKKYQQRLARLRSVSPAAPASEDFDLVKYNVFVLDATPDEMHADLEHLVSRVEDVSVPHSHTDGTDAHAHGDLPDSPPSIYGDEMSMPTTTPGYDQAEQGILDSDVTKANPTKRKAARTLPANTISFAQREKDEMRDLTRASEIVTFFPPSAALLTSNEHDTDEKEKDIEEVSGSSTATFWDPTLGQIFLGNSSDVPMPLDDPLYARRNARHHQSSQSSGSGSGTDACSDACSCSGSDEEEWDWSGNDPAQGFGYDICIECDDLAPFPAVSQYNKAEEHIRALEKAWVERCLRRYEQRPSSIEVDDATPGEEMVDVVQLPPRPPPNSNAVIHLPFPSSVTYTAGLLPFLSWIEALLRPQQPVEVHIHPPKENGKGKGVLGRRGSVATMGNGAASNGFMPSSSLPPPSSFPSSFLSPSESPSSPSGASYQRVRSTSATYLSSSPLPNQPHTLSSSPSSFPSLKNALTPPPPTTVPSQQPLTRPLKILVYSTDGYTESSALALCLLMAFKNLSLPESYLELQVEKRRSFFVYAGEVGALRRVEARFEKERNASLGVGINMPGWGMVGNGKKRLNQSSSWHSGSPSPSQLSFFGSPSSRSRPSPVPSISTSAMHTMSETQPSSAHPLSTSVPKDTVLGGALPAMKARRRASTMPLLPSFADHQVWFNDPRFDGSFPSRVLPFLYLGNLNHAANAYMLHALGITHVVSVGECALVPPPHHYSSYSNSCHNSSDSHACPPQHAPSALWIEEREGRIKVLDIKGVCDDGIDTLEPQLAPICSWIDQARAEGGKVLVHCRVGVSRSATVTIAYVMQYLNVPLVDAYLIVRSRRLSVLIQPNMRLLYNLIGWELKLAVERCGVQREGEGDEGREERLKRELSRCLNWPFLAKEVHALNEKYLR